jgi:hypothetical protein
MDNKDLAERLEKIFERLLGWITAADSKIGSVFAFSTVMLGILAGLFPKAGGWTPAAGSFAVAASIFLCISLLFSTFAAFPRTSGPGGSLLFFGGIASRKSDSYLQELRAVTVDSYLEDLALQCHRNAQIAERKFLWIRRAMVALYLSVVPWLVAIFLLYGES